jgi:hypothetical protein
VRSIHLVHCWLQIIESYTKHHALLAVYLVEGQVVPYARASQLLQELLGVQLSAGSIATFVKTCHEQLADVEACLKEALVKEKVIHQDETGMHVGEEGWWVHVCCTDRLTHYAAHQSRGSQALNAIGIAPSFVAPACMMDCEPIRATASPGPGVTCIICANSPLLKRSCSKSGHKRGLAQQLGVPGALAESASAAWEY